MKLQDILAALPALTPLERQQLLDQLKVLQQYSPTVIDGISDLALAAIIECLRDRGLPAWPDRLRSDRGFRSFQEHTAELQPYVDSVAYDRIHKIAFWRLAMLLLYENLERMNIPITGRTMMQNVQRIPAIIDLHFPGYARAGLLSMIVQREAQHVRRQ